MEYTILIHKAEEGGFWAEVPALSGCFSQGETIEETIANTKEAIEIVVAHRDRSGNGILELFPATWRSGANVQLPESGYIQFPGYVAIDSNNLPHSFGYHVQFASGIYYIDFEDMETLDFIKRYMVTSAPGTSTFTDLAGSSE